LLAAAAAVPAGAAWAASDSASPAESAAFPPAPSRTPSIGAEKKIPIGVFDPVYDNLSLDAMLEKFRRSGSKRWKSAPAVIQQQTLPAR